MLVHQGNMRPKQDQLQEERVTSSSVKQGTQIMCLHMQALKWNALYGNFSACSMLYKKSYIQMDLAMNIQSSLP